MAEIADVRSPYVALEARRPRIVKVDRVKAGMTVKAGDRLFEIDDREVRPGLRVGLAEPRIATAASSAAQASLPVV